MLQIAVFRRAPAPTLRVHLLHIATQLSIAKQTALLPKEQAVRTSTWRVLLTIWVVDGHLFFDDPQDSYEKAMPTKPTVNL